MFGNIYHFFIIYGFVALRYQIQILWNQLSKIV